MTWGGGLLQGKLGDAGHLQAYRGFVSPRFRVKGV